MKSKPSTPDGGCAGNAGRGGQIRSSSPPPRSARKICCIDCGPADRYPRYHRGWANWREPTRRLCCLPTSRTRTDLAQGVAGTSSIHPDVNTHIEAFRAGKGSNALVPLSTTLVDGDKHRLAKWALINLRHPAAFVRTFNIRRASERALLLLVMQDLDNSLTTYLKRGLFGTKMTSCQGKGEPNPNWIPIANDVARRAAEKLDGDPRGLYTDVFNTPTTAHFIGGCAIGDSPASGVVDPYQRLYGYPGLHVIDGSTISANLGANPALTITAQSERAVALWPNKGAPDPRPPLGSRLDTLSRPPNVPRYAEDMSTANTSVMAPVPCCQASKAWRMIARLASVELELNQYIATRRARTELGQAVRAKPRRVRPDSERVSRRTRAPAATQAARTVQSRSPRRAPAAWRSSLGWAITMPMSWSTLRIAGPALLTVTWSRRTAASMPAHAWRSADSRTWPCLAPP